LQFFKTMGDSYKKYPCHIGGFNNYYTTVLCQKW